MNQSIAMRVWILSMLTVASNVIGCDDRELVALPDIDAGTSDASLDGSSDGSMDASLSPADRLQGLWEGACITGTNDVDGGSDTDAGVAESTRQGFAFSGDQLVSRIERYFDPNCQTPIVRVEITGTFSVGDAITGLSDAHQLNIAISGLTAQLLDPDFEDLANAERFLGFNDWTANVPRDVLGVNVFGNSTPIEADDVIYQIFQIVPVPNGNATLPVLYFGNETGTGPILNESQRPTTLSNAPHGYTGPARNN